MNDFDLAVVGSGFGGSLLAMIARRLGYSVVLLERGRHPRFAIGESTSPLANLLLEELATRYDLPRLLPLTSYGSWQQTYPHLTCGLKRGFTFYHHTAGQPFCDDHTHQHQLLVAANPKDHLADTHWYRAEVDQFFMQESVAVGVEYWDTVEVNAVDLRPTGVTLRGTRQGHPVEFRARLLIDATGPRGLLSRLWGLPETAFPDYPVTQTLYTHFTEVRRTETLPEFQTAQTPPYPPDDAALHHLFAGGWMWVLRFQNGITSAGVAMTEPLAQEIRLEGGEAAWKRFLARYPSIGRQFAEAQPTRPFVFAPRLAYRSSRVAGPNWALLPSAAAFVDPLFSTGFPLTLLGVERLAHLLETIRKQDDLTEALRAYEVQTLAEVDGTARFIGACYAALPCFPAFTALSMFYFAAASFSEMARRLQKPELFSGFLACNSLHLAPAMALLFTQVRQQKISPEALAEAIAQIVEPINVAGLCAPLKQNWYGVDLQDVVRGADKLEMTPEALAAVLQTAPWAQMG